MLQLWKGRRVGTLLRFTEVSILLLVGASRPDSTAVAALVGSALTAPLRWLRALLPSIDSGW